MHTQTKTKPESKVQDHMITMSLADWKKEGERRFGPDALLWHFVCPVCGHVQTPLDFKPLARLGATPSSAYSECIGRYIPGSQDAFGATGVGPCNYAGYGLFRLGPISVIDDKGLATQVFAFAACEASEKRRS